MRSRVEQFERIRRDARDEGLSIRELAEKHQVHRRTVRFALADATPPARRVAVRAAPALGPHAATVRGWLIADALVNAERTLTPCCRLNFDPLGLFSMVTWSSWVLRVVARCGARGCGRSRRPGV